MDLAALTTSKLNDMLTIKKIAEETDVKITKEIQDLLEKIQKNAIAKEIEEMEK